MIKRLLIAVAMLCALTDAQVPVTPIVQPHMTFNSSAGLACAGCSLYTYIAGTTTPQPTYTNALGSSQNTNPIILGADGGANIWLGVNSYKFVLIDLNGGTVWSVDQVNAGTFFPCGTSGLNCIVTNPTGSQIIVQPSGTTLSVNSVNSVRYVNPASATSLITQVNALFTACGSNCEVHIPPHDASGGCYTVTSGTIIMNAPGQSLIGDGMGKVCINYAGTNFLDARLASGTYAAQSTTGAVSGFTLTCSNTAAKCMSGGSWVGFQWGIDHDLDIVGPGGLFSDTPIGTSQCLYEQNTFDWYERGSVDFSCEGVQTWLTLDTPGGSGTQSYEYNQFNLTGSLGLGATAVKLGANAQVEHFRSFHLQFNVNGNGTGAQPVIFDIGANAILNGGDGVIVGEGGTQPYTMAHVRAGGFAQVEGSITTFASPTYVIDALGTGSYPWNWGPAAGNGLLYSTAGPPVLTHFPLSTSTINFDVHAAHLGSLTANSDYMEGMLQDTTNGFSTPFRAGNSNEYICDANYNSFGNLNSLVARACSDGFGNFWPMRAFQLVGLNGPTDTISTKSSVAADGDVILASGVELAAGSFLVTFNGPARAQLVQIEIGASQFDTNVMMSIPVNYSFSGQVVLTNFRITESVGGSPQLIATIGNRNAGTQLTVTAYGDAVFATSLLPGGTPGSTATTNTGVSVFPAVNGVNGFQINGTAVNTHCLVGNGTYYVDGACSSGAGISLTTTGSSGAATLTGTVLNIPIYTGGGGSGTVTTFSAGTLAPLFTTSVATATTTPALSFALTNAAQNSIFAGPPTGGAGVPSYQTAPTFSAANLTSFPTFNQNTSGTAANLSGTPALPNGTTATTQSPGDNTTKLATDAFVLANAGSLPDCVDTSGVSLICTVPFTAPQVITTGSTQGLDLLGVGTGTISTSGWPTNYTGWVGPPSGTPAYLLQGCSTAPSGGQVMSFATPGTVNGVNQSVCSWTTVSSGISNTTLTVGTTSVSANSCTTVATLTMTGLATTNTLSVTPNSDVSAVTGWGPGSSGQLYFIMWPSASNTASYYVCNPTSGSITPGGSTTWNVSAK